MTIDPRVYFASERTLLAWVRTGIAIEGVGFLVAKFALFLRVMGHQEWVIQGQTLSTLLGMLFVLIGSLSIAVAGWQHHSFVRQLEPDQLPMGYPLWSSLWLAGLLALLGLLLAGYLAVTSSGRPASTTVPAPLSLKTNTVTPGPLSQMTTHPPENSSWATELRVAFYCDGSWANVAPILEGRCRNPRRTQKISSVA